MEKIIQPIYRNMAKPFVLVFAKLKFHPNAVTLIGLGLSVIVGLLITQGLLRIAIVFYILMVIMDHADGQLARKLNLSSKFGAYFDSVFDRIRIPILLIPVSLYVYHLTYEIEALIWGFVANAVMLINETLFLMVKDSFVGVSDKIKAKANRSSSLSLLRKFVAIDFLGLVNHSIIFIAFLAIGSLYYYLILISLIGIYQIALKILRQFIVLRTQN